MGRYFTPRCFGFHATLLVLLPIFCWLTTWQLGRALGGNTLSWAYTFEWPLFAGYAIYIWWQLIHDQPNALYRHGTGGQPVAESMNGHISVTSDDQVKEPGWALNGAAGGTDRREQRVRATTASTSRHSRVRDQTPEEAEALAEYNRYLTALSADRAERQRQ